MKKRLAECDKRRLVFYGILLVITAIYYYTDINSNIRQGMLFWESLFSGRFLHYYSLNIEVKQSGIMDHTAAYGMLTNFLMGIWQLPLYLIEKISGVANIQDYFLARVYGKLYLLILLYLTSRTVRRILEKVGVDKESSADAVFMLESGILTIDAVCLASQIDILGVWVTLLAIEALLDKDEKKFLAFFIFAGQIKFFSLFILIPAYLLHEKRIWKLGLTAVSPLVVGKIIDLPFILADPDGIATKYDREARAITSLLEGKAEIIGGGAGILGTDRSTLHASISEKRVNRGSKPAERIPLERDSGHNLCLLLRRHTGILAGIFIRIVRSTAVYRYCKIGTVCYPGDRIGNTGNPGFDV